MRDGKSGLLFRLSGENGLAAEWAAGAAEPNFCEGARSIEDGAFGGRAVRCDGAALRLSYLAPGNVYAARGTLSLFFRPVTPVGETPFPIFRVGFSDHTSWDAVFLRIDYNGGGFEAFVTDNGLARVRVRCRFAPIDPDRWTHLAFSWDERQGVKLYVNGALCARRAAFAQLDAGLDQFGPFSRLISHWNVQSMFNYVRGGDFDELLIFDHMLTDEAVHALCARGELPAPRHPAPDWRAAPAYAAWMARHGWERPDHFPPPLAAGLTRVRKVEIHEAYDGPRWYWKACDGILETTWPGVYNRSRLPGRSDYFLLPDWDCYSISGREIRFVLPQEPWNHVEFVGAAYGLLSSGDWQRRVERGARRTAIRLDRPRLGGELIFRNDEQETPINEVALFEVREEAALPDLPCDEFSFDTGRTEDAFSVQLYEEIAGRRPREEVRVLTAGAPRAKATGSDYPTAHLVVPGGRLSGEALWMVALELPERALEPVVGGAVPMNVRVCDPIWPDRALADFSFTLPDARPRTLLMEVRKRILRPGDGLYLTLDAAGTGMDDDFLRGLRVRVYYASRRDALPEHVKDRFTQVKDVYAHMVEERPGDARLRLFRRFRGDIMDLLSADPGHFLAQCYLYDSLSTCNAQIEGVQKPPYRQTPLQGGAPAWAQRQIEYMGYVKRFLSWWIDVRQIENGEFGGGLSDDGDLTSWWPGPALCGLLREKVTASLRREMGAFLDQGMLTNGLSTIQTDEMHVFEEGITALGQCLLADGADPQWLELAMENARAVERISGFNAAGHRHFLSSYFSGVRLAREAPWNGSTGNSYLICHPLYLLARYNRSPRLIKLIAELADGILAHWKDGAMHVDVRFDDDADAPGESDKWVWALAAAYDLTGEERYLVPIRDRVRACKRLEDQIGDEALARRYEALIEAAALREYLNTEAHLWVDRVVLDIEQLQIDRLGGVAHQRFEVYPRHYLSWRFERDEDAERVAIVTPEAGPARISLRAYNLKAESVRATATLWGIAGGLWTVDDGRARTTARLGRGAHYEVVFAPRCETRWTFALEQADDGAPLLPDLGLSPRDVRVENSGIRVTVHSLGGAPSAPARAALYDRRGELVSDCPLPALEAPEDLRPVRYDVILPAPRDADLTGFRVVLDPDGINREITRDNNAYTFE